jgi:hypothetical protein
MFRSRNQLLRFQPEEGMQVLVRGKVSLVLRLTSRGSTEECAGNSRTSSKVRASCTIRIIFGVPAVENGRQL